MWICVLCVNGLRVVTVTQDGSTMLMEAAKGGHFETMSLLLDWPTSSSASHAATSADTVNKVTAASCIVHT